MEEDGWHPDDADWDEQIREFIPKMPIICMNNLAPSSSWFMVPLERPLAQGCQWWCRFVARHPWPFILLPILSTIILSSGLLLKFRVVRGVNYLYSALDAPWKMEYGTFIEHWAGQDEHFYPGKDAILRPGFFIIATARDNGSVLRSAHSQQIIHLIDWIKSIKVEWPNDYQYSIHHRRLFSFSDVCLHYPAGRCFSNENARILAQMFANSNEQVLKEFAFILQPNPFNVTFPQFAMPEFGPEPLDLSFTLGGVKQSAQGKLLSAQAWMLVFQLRQNPHQSVGQLSSQFEHSMANLLQQNRAPTPLLNLAHYHSGIFDRELAENALQLAPKFGITFGVLVLFAILCTFDWLRMPISLGEEKPRWFPAIDWVRSKPWLGIFGVLCTLMAISSATGLLIWANVTFVDMCSVMPFLSLTIGIDDTFLMLAAWRSTNPAFSVEERVEQAMRHAAVSISITSLTDALAFLIGSIAPLPAIIYFCYYSSLAILFIFVHFMTMFIAILTLQGHWEAKGRNCIFGWSTRNVDNPISPIQQCTSILPAFLNSGRHFPHENSFANSSTNFLPEKLQSSPQNVQHWSQRWVASFYVPLITHWAIQFIAAFSFIAYGFIAFKGVQRLTIGFKLIDIISYDQGARQFLLLRQQFFPADVQRLELAVMRPPNLGRSEQRAAFLQALTRLESVPNCTGQSVETSQFWFRQWRAEAIALRHGDEFDKMDLDEESFALTLRPFVRANPRFDYDLLRKNDDGFSEKIEAFRLSIQLIPQFADDGHLMRCASKIRSICWEYAEQFGLISYSPLWNLADQFEIIWPQTMQDLYISVGVMAFISLLAIPRPFCAFVVGANILSIGFGVIGFMPFLGVNLDATSMITIAMSVGFSVDFAAHITYSYILVAEGKHEKLGNIKSKVSPRECLKGALCAVGWPISQASFSVLLGICPLAAVNTHIIQTCFKTVFLVIIFGGLHALFYLPLALMNIHHLHEWANCKWTNLWRKSATNRRAIFIINK